MRNVLILLAGLALAACNSPSTNGPTSSPTNAYSFPTGTSAFRKALVGKTLKFDSAGHGTQIEYFAPDGKAYLWYPGNTRAVPSNWKVVSPTGTPLVCFQYPSQSYNPVTKNFGGEWECQPNTSFAKKLSDIVEGDPFNLQSGGLPAQMQRRAVLTMEQVLALTPAQENITYVYRK